MKWSTSLTGLLVAALAALTFLLPAAAQAKPLVAVSILPQRYFVRQIAGNLVDVEVMVLPGASPATYEPTPRQMTELSRAAIYFSVGVPFERAWLPRFAAANPSMKIVRTDEGIHKVPMAAHSHHGHEADHDHGHDHGAGHDHHAGHGAVPPPPEHGHDHADHMHPAEHDHEHAPMAEHDDHHAGIPDPHVWLSPRLARVQAQHICDALARLNPDNAATYRANLQALSGRIDALDAEIHHVLDAIPASRRAFLVFHPSWGYFARDYGLRQIAIESEGKEPGPQQLAEIIEHGRENGVNVVFVQKQFSDKSARIIASELDATVVPLDPLAADWADNLLTAARAFRKALR